MKRFAKISFVLILVAVLGYLLMPHDRKYRRELEAYKKELIAKGEKLTLAELAPAASTNAGNAAGRLLGATNATVAAVGAPSMMFLVGPGVAKVGHNDSRPAAAAYEVNTNNAAQLRAVLQGATELNFNLDYLKGAALPLPHLSKLRAAGQLLPATAVQALSAKDYPEGWADLLAGAELVRLFKGERTMVSANIRSIMAQGSISATWEFLQDDHGTERQWAELQGRWEDMNLFGDTEGALRFERASVLAGLGTERKGEPPSLAVLKGIASGNGQRLAVGYGPSLRQKLEMLYNYGPGYWSWRAQWADEEELYALQLDSAELAAVGRVRSTGAFVPVLAEFERAATNIIELHREGLPHFRAVSPMETTGFSNWMVRQAKAESARRLTVTGIALKRYQIEHGVFPASLKELVPAELAEVPVDFMDGRPVRYQRRADGSFLLYSVGLDGEDNGGDATASAGNDWLSGRDMVWPRAATVGEVLDYFARGAGTTNK